MQWLLVAYDNGPRQTLSPLLNSEKFVFEEFREAETVNQWKAMLSELSFYGVVVSTSKSDHGRLIERNCCIAAKELGLFVVTIEDYPFNFDKKNQSLVDLLIVESDFVKNEYLLSNPISNTKIETGALIRYEFLRSASFCREKSFGKVETNKVLWIGQPETDCCLASLKRIMPVIRSLGLKLDFRAHPDDSGYYLMKSYDNFFINYEDCIEDVSMLTIDRCVERNPFITLTQFSSLAIELAFKGIPSLHLLYHDLGGALFCYKNQRRYPVICEVGASIVITKVGEEFDLLNKLKLKKYREVLIAKFDNYYSNSVSLDYVIDKINALSLTH